MFVSQEKIYQTEGYFGIIDVTDDIKNFIKERNVKNGLFNVFTRHTTAVIKINEAEAGLRKDLKNWSKSHIPADYPYHHNDLVNRDPKTMCDSKDECLNGHSHIASMMFGVSSETIPVIDGQMTLGVWQRILFIEMDHSRPRTLVFSFMGEGIEILSVKC